MKLATTTSDFFRETKCQLKSAECIEKSGFKYIDYSFGEDYDNNSGIFSDDPKGYLEILKKHLHTVGAELVQAHSPMGAPIAEDNGKFVSDTIKCVEACNELGIKNIVVHSGYRQGLTKEETFEENKKFFLQILREAEKYDVNILVENFNKMEVENLYWIDNAPDLLALIEYVNHPLFHAVWDTGHGNMQEMSQEESLKILGKHVYALHVHDNFGDKDTHMAPFTGSMNFDSLMHGLFAIGYKGYFTFEACNFFQPQRFKRKYEKDTRLLNPSLDLKLHAEKLLYEMGKYILEEYNCFEE